MVYRKLIILFILIGILIWGEASPWAAPLESLVPRKALPEGWALIHGPQTYTRKTLFEHVNGQAELFFKYGFQKSVFAIYQNKKESQDQIELDIYDMGNVVQAFGIFSRFRNEDRPGGFGLDSYLDDRSAFFYKGKYFVMVYGTESHHEMLRQFSTFISSSILDPSPPPQEIDYFPKNRLKSGSIQYFPEGLLGHQFLKRGFQGIYIENVDARVESKEYKLFLAIFKNSEEAMNTLKVYRENLSKKGKPFSGSFIQSGNRALKGEDPYQGKIIVLQKGFYLLGVVGFKQEEFAENLLAELVKKVG
jgi:hypothetical protein